MMRSLSSALVLLVLLFVSISAHANSGELLSFQGIQDMQAVGNFYNGAGISITPNYGISFSSNFFGLRSVFNGGSGNFSATPVGNPAIFISNGSGPNGAIVMGTMNVAPGFSNGLNFFYTAGFATNQAETITVWSGANGTGTVLATMTLSNNNSACSAPLYCNWSNAGLSFSGTAHSVTFSGPANELGLADITVGSSTSAVPEPGTMYLFGSGLLAISLGSVRRYFRLG
jgi:hypothetical protein